MRERAAVAGAAAASSSTSYLKIALMIGLASIGGYRVAGCSRCRAHAPATWQRGNLVVVVVLFLVGGERRIFERHFLARLQSLDDLHARVVGETADDDAFLEPLLPRVFVVL